MRVFLSWSGERSGQVAAALRVWLTDVLHALDPWISSEDIDKGAQWNLQLAEGLQSTSVGIVCLTPENLNAPWILFESGALARSVHASRVCTYLLELRPTDIHGPLASFQATEANRTDTLRLLRMLNGQLGEHARPDDQLSRAFEKWWPEFEGALVTIRLKRPSAPVARPERELLEDILRSVRRQERSSADVERSWRQEYSGLQEWLSVDPEEANNLLEAFEASRGRFAESSDVLNASAANVLDGTWISQWEMHDRNMTGVAKLISGANLLVGLDDERSLGTHLLIARKRHDDLLVGRWVNTAMPRDSGGWVGRVVSASRIDGQWNGGRWGFLRTPDGT